MMPQEFQRDYEAEQYRQVGPTVQGELNKLRNQIMPQLPELILTLVVPATEDEPLHTQIYRFGFETIEVALEACALASTGAIDGGKMITQPEPPHLPEDPFYDQFIEKTNSFEQPWETRKRLESDENGPRYGKD